MRMGSITWPLFLLQRSRLHATSGDACRDRHQAHQDQNKDSIANIEATGVFCVNVVSHAQQDALLSSPPSGGENVNQTARAIWIPGLFGRQRIVFAQLP